eukprot:Em0009g319a
MRNKTLTAGIIAHRIKNPKANMIVYDLAGHREYYSSHSSILEHISNTTPSVFLLLVNLLLTLKEITVQLYYWSAMIGNVCSKCPQQSSIIVVGTHADCVVDKSNLESLSREIEKVAGYAMKEHTFVQFTALDVTSFCAQNLNNFMALLYGIIDDIRIKCPAISLGCHVMFAFLNDKVPENVITFSQLLTLLRQEQPKYLPTEDAEVSILLKTLSEKGFIVFFDTNRADSWIVIRLDMLLEKVNGVLFAPKDFDEYQPIASNIGIIPKAVLKKQFPEPVYNIDMITEFLIRFELCQPIILAPTNTTPQVPLTSSCPDLFFPPLVCARRPDDVTIPTDAFLWQICTININQTFSPRFLHVLISRIINQFPLPAVDMCPNPDLQPYSRSCTVWSKGISWVSEEGFTAVVEMKEDFQCLMCAVSTTDKTSTNYSKLILSVIDVISEACNEFCKSVSRVERIVCPLETTDHVAITIDSTTLKTAVSKSSTTVRDWTGKKVVDINEWKVKEPQLFTLIGVELKQAVLCADNHTEICQNTKSASSKWRAIGGELGFTFDELDSIVREPGRNGVVDYYQAMLRRWLDWAPPNHTDPTLQHLISALRAVGKEKQAANLLKLWKK